MDKYKLCLTVCILVISCIVIVSTACNIIGVDLPDVVTRILGIVDLLAVFLLVFSMVKLKVWKKDWYRDEKE